MSKSIIRGPATRSGTGPGDRFLEMPKRFCQIQGTKYVYRGRQDKGHNEGAQSKFIGRQRLAAPSGLRLPPYGRIPLISSLVVAFL